MIPWFHDCMLTMHASRVGEGALLETRHRAATLGRSCLHHCRRTTRRHRRDRSHALPAGLPSLSPGYFRPSLPGTCCTQQISGDGPPWASVLSGSLARCIYKLPCRHTTAGLTPPCRAYSRPCCNRRVNRSHVFDDASNGRPLHDGRMKRHSSGQLWL